MKSLSFTSLSLENVTQAVLEITNEENIVKNIDVFKHNRISKTYRSKFEIDGCFWKKVFRKLLSQKRSNAHRETMKKYVERTYDFVRRLKTFYLVKEVFKVLKKKKLSGHNLSPKSEVISQKSRESGSPKKNPISQKKEKFDSSWQSG